MRLGYRRACQRQTWHAPFGAEPATVRRLFATRAANPTLGTLAEVAAALGLRIRVEALAAAEREAVTAPLRAGNASKAILRRARAMRKVRSRVVASG